MDQTFWVKFKETRIDNELKIFDNAKNNNINQDKMNKNKNNQNQEIMKGKRVPQKK